MAEDRAGSSGEHGGHPVTLRGELRVADGVYAAVDRM
jgi:hypothetical protein